MEIYGQGLSYNLLYRNNARGAPAMELPAQKRESAPATFTVQEDTGNKPDFTAITPRDMRDVALASYQSGQIGAEEYNELAAELPTHTVASTGEVLDLSEVTDDTSFDFIGYFNDRVAIARSVGDPQKAEILQSVVDFLTVR